MRTKLKKLTTLFLTLAIMLTFLPVFAHPTTTTVNGIVVNVSSSVSDSSYNTFISWIKNIPSFLKQNVTSINVVDNISYYNPTGGNVSGLTQGSKIYINSSSLTSRKGSFYHELGHVLDNAMGYSYTSAWESIRKSEWASAGYYSTSLESFAEAVSYYYVDGISGKPKSKAAIENIINYGFIEGSNGLISMNKTLYTNSCGLYMYSGPSDFTNNVGMIPVGKTATVIGKTSAGDWYLINYNGKTGYVLASKVSFERDASFPYYKTLFINGEEYEIECKSGTYQDIWNKIKSLGYSNFEVYNNWGTRCYSYFNVNEDKPCYATNLSKDIVKTFTINGTTYKVTCPSKTYKEVFDKIKSLGYTTYTVKNAWGTIVYSYYGTQDSETITVSNLSKKIVNTFTYNGSTYSVTSTSGTYKEVIDRIFVFTKANTITARNSYGSSIQRWYNAEPGHITFTIVN